MKLVKTSVIKKCTSVYGPADVGEKLQFQIKLQQLTSI